MRLRLAALLLGIVLLTTSVVAAVRSGQQRARSDRLRALSNMAADQAAVLDAYFERARAINLLLARNPAFTDFYARSGVSRRRVAHDVNAALGYLEKLYPGRIGEACFIDASGVENARVVDGVWAKRADLSPDESTSPFFAPTFAGSGPNEVYQARPYLSPDTHTWVISNSTVVPDGPGAGRAIVHFEVTLDSFGREARRGAHDLRVQIVDASTPQVLIDTQRPQPAGRPVGRPGDAAYAALAGGGRSGRMELRGHPAAYHRVPHQPGNANDWYVVVTSPAAGSVSWWRSLGADDAAMAVAALLLLAFALSSLRAYQRDLRAAALHDELTGLPNRTLFRDRLRQAALSARRDGALTAALMIDLDRFKEINDTLGHHQGDRLLQQLGERLRATLREADTVARFGGDEFAVLVPRLTTAAEAAEVARRIAEAMAEPFTLDGVAIHVEASVGIALAPLDAEDPDTLIQRADIAMYDAKHRSSEGHAFYTPERDPYSPRRLAMVAELRAAIEGRELEVHYQPKIELATGKVTGVEALARWEHPELGPVSPGEFVPLAEQTGLIKPLTIAVLESALEQARLWADDGLDLCVSVNLSVRNLLDPRIAIEIGEMLRRFGVAPERLELEITESTIMADEARAHEVLTTLNAMGVRLSIDDFGTGYSSLAYLKGLPVDELKIDRGFVMSMSADEADAFIVRCAIDLGRNLGLRVVAEGVEDEATAGTLADLGCSAAQGYYFSRPVPAPQLTQWLAERAAALPRA